MQDTPISATSLRLRNFIIIWGFAASGFAALIYEVVWQRALTNTIGSSAYTFSIILAAFMAGLAIGGHLGGAWLMDRRDYVRIFAWLQLATGVFGVMTFYAINNLEPVYVMLFHLTKDNFHLLSVAQMSLVLLIMLIPTTLMGAAFPVIFKAWSFRIREIGRTAGDIYSINTWGSVLGAMAAGFILVPMIGLRTSNFIAATVNIVLGVFAFYVSHVYEPYPEQEINDDWFKPGVVVDAGD